MSVTEKITGIIGPSLEAMGYDIVLIKLAENARRKTLTVMAERKDGAGMSFDDCTAISQTAGALLEVDDPITTAYDLEVCSPGVDRPLTKLGDYTRFAGYEAKIETHIPVDGRKRFRGVIGKTTGEEITITMPDGEARIAFGTIRTAKLAISSEQILKKGKKK